MEANIVTEHVVVRERPDGTSPVVAELAHGDRITLGQATFKRAWVQVTTPDGKVGHMRGEATTRAEPMAQAIVVGGPMRIRLVRDMNEPHALTISAGDIVSTGAVSAAQYLGWTEIATVEGVHGYVEGEPHVQRIVWSQLIQPSATIHGEPNSASAEIRTISANAIIGIGPASGTSQHPWLRAVLPDGTQGYVAPTTEITRLDAEMRLRRLLRFPGKCVKCEKDADVTICNLHLTNPRTGQHLGDCFVPVCRKCVDGWFYFSLISLFTLGAGATVGTALSGMNLLGAIAFVPFLFYSMNAAHTGSTVRRYRRVAERVLGEQFEQAGVAPAELTIRQEDELDELWPGMRKWIICPRCHKLHRDQAPWCPQCRYIFPWRFGPRP